MARMGPTIESCIGRCQQVWMRVRSEIMSQGWESSQDGGMNTCSIQSVRGEDQELEKGRRQGS